MSEKQFVPQDWRTLEEKQAQEKDVLGKKHSDEKEVLKAENESEAIEMNAQIVAERARIDEARARLEELTGKKMEVKDSKMESSIEQLKKGWENFYQEVFGLEVDFSNLEIPEKQEGFEKLLIMAPGLDAQKILDKCNEFFKTFDVDLSTVRDLERATDSAYAVWERDRVEADEENQNLSADKIKEMGIATQTLRERLLQELEHFKKTGAHLDMQNVTLCAGSRHGDGDVPGVDWRSGDGRLDVYWNTSDRANDDLRARQVVS